MFHLIQKFTHLPGTVRRRVGFLWSINFLYQTGFILSWVVITSLFIEQFGINNLLGLFFLEALLMVIGSALGRTFFLKYKDNHFLLGSLICLAISLAGAFFFRDTKILFFVFAIIGKSLIYPQLRIGLLRKIESFFSPRTGRKAIPVIESAETVGTIVSATFIVLLLNIFLAEDILYFWGISLGLMAVALVSEEKFICKIKDFKEGEILNYKNVSKNIFSLHQRKQFQRALMALILFQGILFGVVEYEFTKEVNFEFTHEKEFTFNWQSMKSSVFKETLEEVVEIEKSAEKFVTKKVQKFTSSKIAHENIAHDLGLLSLLFGVISLIFKLGITSKIIKKIGSFRTIQLYFSGLFAFFMFYLFGKTSMYWVRGYEHSCHSLFASPYHVSFYSTDAKKREFLRHLLEGILKPIGIIIAVGGIVFLQNYGLPSNYLMIPLGIAVIILSTKLHKEYEQYTLENFFSTKSIEERIHILEVVGEFKQKKSAKILAEYLVKRKDEPQILREKIIETLTHLKNPSIIHEYLEILNNPNESIELKKRILESIISWKSLKSYCKKNAFTEVRLLETLESLFNKAHDHYTKKIVIMNIFSHIPSSKTVAFLRMLLKNHDPEIISICLRSCKDFSDPEIVSEIKPYLFHTSSRVKAHAIVAIWNFYSRKNELQEILCDMLAGHTEEEKISAIYALGELKQKKYKQKIQKVFQESTGFLKAHCIIALLKFGYTEYVNELLRIISGEDEHLAKRVFHMRKRLPHEIREKVEIESQKYISEKIQNILQQECIQETNDLKKISVSNKQLLHRLYEFTGRYENMYVLSKI